MDLFAAWTPAERWLAGLLWADGHIVPRRRRAPGVYRGPRPGPRTIVLNLTDRPVLDEAAAVIGAGHRFHKAQPPRLPTHQQLHRLVFNDTLGELTRLGFGPKPDRSWPAEIGSASFLRGLFDGDGSVFWHDGHGTARRYLQAAQCGPAAVLEGARDWLADQGVPRKNINRHGSSWIMTWQHADSLRLAEVIYGESGPCMLRKRECFRRQGSL